MKGDPKTTAGLTLTCCKESSSLTISITNQTGTLFPGLPLLRVPIFQAFLLWVTCVPWNTLRLPWNGGPGGPRGLISALTERQRINRPPVPRGTASRAPTNAGSYLFSPRTAPSRRPGGGISARPGGRGPAGPGAFAAATSRCRGCALRLGEPGQARSTGASPGRTRGAFAARALGSGGPSGSAAAGPRPGLRTKWGERRGPKGRRR